MIEVLEEYKKCLSKFLKQEKWMEEYPKAINTKIEEAFKETLGKLGDIGYRLEVEYGYSLSLEEKLNPEKLEYQKKLIEFK